VLLEFDNKRRFVILREDIEEYFTASQKDASDIEITENGNGLRWPLSIWILSFMLLSF
jgi:hypothetical protein